jgi:hypothetical protein
MCVARALRSAAVAAARSAGAELARGARAVASGLFAVPCCRFSILGGQRAVLRGLGPALRGAVALPRRPDEPVGVAERVAIGVLIVGDLARGHRAITRFGRPIARKRRNIARSRVRIALLSVSLLSLDCPVRAIHGTIA